MELMNTCLFYVGQVWDPFTLESLRQLDNNGSNQAITAMTALPGPSTMIVTATNEAMLRQVTTASCGFKFKAYSAQQHSC